MRLFVVRHGIAEDPSLNRPDFARALTEAGINRLRLQARAMVRSELIVDRIFNSPLVRATQTAEILAAELEVSQEEDQLLAPGCRLGDVQELLRRNPELRRVMIVGHQPDFGEIVRDLTGAAVKMRKGTVVDVEIGGPDSAFGVLRGLYDPEVLAYLGA